MDNEGLRPGAEQDPIADTEDIEGEVVINKASPETIQLPSGEALTVDQTYPITASNKAHFVVLAGPTACGKTTLVTTLYQMFLRGPVGDYYFAGSCTLQGFEQRAFLSRTDSRGSIPEIPRTGRGIYDSILHLCLWNSVENHTYHLLLSDFSGEDYDSAIANVSLMKSEFGIIKSADIIIILLDGEGVTNKQKRHAVVQRADELLHTIRDAELLGEGTYVYIVVSKYDLVVEHSEEDSSVIDFVNLVKTRFEVKFEHLKGLLHFAVIAAMPQLSSEFEIGHGLTELLSSWMTRSDMRLYRFNPPHSMLSEFNNFKERILGGPNG